MADERPVVYITTPDRRTFVYHLWKSTEKELDADISDAPGLNPDQGSRGDVVRIAPPMMRLNIDLKKADIPVTGPSSNVFQTEDFAQQLADLEAMHMQVVSVTTRMASIRGIVKSIRAIDEGFPVGARVTVEVRPINPVQDGGRVLVGRIITTDNGIQREWAADLEARLLNELQNAIEALDPNFLAIGSGAVHASGNVQCNVQAGGIVEDIEAALRQAPIAGSIFGNVIDIFGAVIGAATPVVEDEVFQSLILGRSDLQAETPVTTAIGNFFHLNTAAAAAQPTPEFGRACG